MPGRMEFEYRFGGGRPASARRQQQPMRMLVMGDFSGAATRAPLADRRVVSVDLDNFGDVLRRFSPSVEMQTPGSPGATTSVVFDQLDSFHPDELYDRLPVFQALRDLRRRLLDPATFADAAAGLQQAVAGPVTAGTQPGPGTQQPASTFEQLLGGPAPGAASTGTASTGTEASTAAAGLIRSIVEPHIVPDADPKQDQLVASVDDAISQQMREVLHHADFQALESLWRGLDRIITGLETREQLRVFVLDVTSDELAADILAAGGDLASTVLHRLLVEQTTESPDGEPWTVIAGNYTFDASERDVMVLQGLGAIASRAGGPFIAAAAASLLGCDSLAESPDAGQWRVEPASAERWSALRRSPAASWLGLATPRVLQRLPYGARTEALDRFDFEELSPWHDHERYLWGNPALACVTLIGLAFEDNGWSMQPGDRLDVEDLPAHTYDQDGESKMKPCAEVLLGDRVGETILGRGLMPLLSYGNRNAARLLRFQSLADPPAMLSGCWTS